MRLPSVVIRVCVAAALLAPLSCSAEPGTIDLLPADHPPSTCFDTLLDGNETDVDCGGACPGCQEGKVCEEAADCVDGTDCVGKKCRAL